MRHMASIQEISHITPIEGADNIETAWINGWTVVTQKSNNFKPGDLVVYFEIDSWIPHALAPFLSKSGKPRSYNDVLGEKLRTIKLRGQLSQGLIMPLAEILKYLGWTPGLSPIGYDLTEALNIQKWEKPIPGQLAGVLRGNFPSFIRKTDQERIQNLTKYIPRWQEQNQTYEVTLKLDGSSMTVYYKDGEVGVCSRNIDLQLTDENADNAFVKMAHSSGLIECLKKIGQNIAVQGELWGQGIQGNWEGVESQFFSVFDIWDIDNHCYLTPIDRAVFVDELYLNGYNQYHVDCLAYRWKIREHTLETILNLAEGPSVKNKIREGLVFKANDGSHSFKVISNEFLLKQKD